MTCVVGVAEPGKGAVVGFDSLGAAGWSKTIRADDKGAQLKPWLAFAYTTSYRFGQILAHHLDFEDDPPANPFEWCVRTFVPAARQALKVHGYLKIDNNREESGDVLLAVRDKILVVYSDFSVGESRCGFDSVGSACHEAKGALHVLNGIGAMQAARKALTAAQALNAGVQEPFHFLRTKA